MGQHIDTELVAQVRKQQLEPQNFPAITLAGFWASATAPVSDRLVDLLRSYLAHTKTPSKTVARAIHVKHRELRAWLDRAGQPAGKARLKLACYLYDVKLFRLTEDMLEGSAKLKFQAR